MAPHANDDVEVVYNAKLLSEKLSKADLGSAEIPSSFLTTPENRPTVPYDSWADVPTLDLSEAESDEAGLARKMVDAASELGWFTFANHGIPHELIEQVDVEGHKFFNLPYEEKQKIGLLARFRGYTGDYKNYGLERMVWHESLMMDLPSTQPDDFASKVWPERALEFSGIIRNYTEAMKKVQIRILELLAIGLGLDRDFFAKHFTPPVEHGNLFRWNYYPTCPRPLDVMGILGHTDSLVLTILHDGGIGGLQFLKDEEWKGVKPASGALVCNCADFIEAWTNNRLHSPLHRVVVNEEKARLSTVIFLNIDKDTVLSAPSSLVEDIGEKRLYRDFNILEFHKAFNDDMTATGKFPITRDVLSKAFGIKSD